jgi:hypothetical protein
MSQDDPRAEERTRRQAEVDRLIGQSEAAYQETTKLVIYTVELPAHLWKKLDQRSRWLSVSRDQYLAVWLSLHFPEE